jgi:UDP-glucuronate decarboxylase
VRRQLLTGTKDNIAHLLANPRFELLRHDITFPLYVEVDEIYNLACPASPIHYQRDPVQTTKTSVHGAINMLGLAKRTQGQDPAGLDQRGLRRPGRPPADRGLLGQRQPDRPALLLRRGQALRRDAVLRLSPPARLRIKVARIFNTYGPRMHPNDGRVVSNFIVQALRGQPITIYGDGSRPAPSATSTTWSTAWSR